MFAHSIKTCNNFYVCAVNGGGNGVVVDRTQVGIWETFTLFHQGENQISLQTNNGHYICAEPSGGVVADRTEAALWETFTLIFNNDNTFSLKDSNNHYLSARNGGGSGSILTADKDQIGIWEKFTFVYYADLSVELDSVHFSGIDPGSEQPTTAWFDTLSNESNAEVSKTVSKIIKQDSSFEFALSETLTLGASAEFEADIPFLGSAKTTVSSELALNSSQAWSTTQTEEYVFSSTVTVPANTSVKVVGTLYWLEDAKVPFEARYWVSAKDKNGIPMINADIQSFIKQNGFSGTVIDLMQEENRILIALTGYLTGSWGTKTDIQVEPIE
jgi:hypothetical protein